MYKYYTYCARGSIFATPGGLASVPPHPVLCVATLITSAVRITVCDDHSATPPPVTDPRAFILIRRLYANYIHVYRGYHHVTCVSSTIDSRVQGRAQANNSVSIRTHGYHRRGTEGWRHFVDHDAHLLLQPAGHLRDDSVDVEGRRVHQGIDRYLVDSIR